MSSKVLIAFATNYGSTREVAETIAATLRDRGLVVDILPFREIRALTGYSAIAMGAPLVRYSLHKDLHAFLSRNRQALVKIPIALFALGPVHDPYDAKEWQGSQEQLDKESSEFSWLTPITVKLFGGKFDPALLRFPLNKMAGSEPASDIRDWNAIRAWAESLLEKLPKSA